MVNSENYVTEGPGGPGIGEKRPGDTAHTPGRAGTSIAQGRVEVSGPYVASGSVITAMSIPCSAISDV